MNWTNKLWTLRTDALKELQKLLETKEYDKSELSGQEMYYLPQTIYSGDLGAELFSIYLYNKEEECFMGKGWDSAEDYSFTFDDLDTQTICNLTDLINES